MSAKTSRFSSAGLVEQLIWNSRMADLPRGTNRAQIERLANGHPPYTKAEKEQHRIDTNVNFLHMPEFLADARRSYYNGFLKPGAFFTITLDGQDPHKSAEWASILTREINRPLKKSRGFYNFILSQGALLVLHGIAPGVWRDEDHWCPRIVGIEDVLIPSDTDNSLENLPYIAIFRQLTAMELYKATHGTTVDKAWNLDLVDSALDWAKSQWWKERSYADLYSPQKLEALYKEDLGYMGTDAVPTIDCWDFYYWDDADKQEGWRRKMILDSPPAGQITDRVWTKPPNRRLPHKNLIGKPTGEKAEWLYDAGDRVYAEKLDSIIHFQFADCSGVSPFKYHATRGLGWMLFAPAHIQNRLICRVMDAAFEDTTQFFRAAGLPDHERITKVDLQNKGIVPEGIAFVKKDERWQTNSGLQELAMTTIEQRMQSAAAQYREGRQTDTDKREKTATQIMSEVNAANALFGALLMQAYKYQGFLYEEICRRFTKANSSDKDVRDARARILKAKVPQEILDNIDAWNIEPERVLGGGNKILEVAMAQKLMEAIQLYEPEAQREIMHIYTLANTDNPDLTNRLVPLGARKVSDSAHDAQLMLGCLMDGVAIKPVKGQNAIEVAGELLNGMKVIIGRIKAGLTPPTPHDVVGLSTIAGAINQYLQQVAGVDQFKPAVKAMEKALAENQKEIDTMVKAIGMGQPQQGGNGEADKDKAKVQAMLIQAQTKAKLAAQSHAQKTVQRETQFKMGMQQKQEQHALDMAKKSAEAALDLEKETQKNRMKSLEE